MYAAVRTLYQSSGTNITLCRCQITGRQVVVKAGATIRNDLELFQLIKQNPHRHIVEYDQNNSMGNALVMEYYSGGDLFSYMEQYQMSASMIQRVVREISQALSHLHSLGIAHLDISLENVLLDNNLSCRLADFQVAKQIAAASHDRQPIGKLFYMAPEVYNSRSAYNGFQADIWSLGIFIFILLTGSPLCEVASIENEHYRQFAQHGVREILSSWEVQNIPDQAVDLLEQLLVIQSNQRASIQEVLTHPYLN